MPTHNLRLCGEWIDKPWWGLVAEFPVLNKTGRTRRRRRSSWSGGNWENHIICLTKRPERLKVWVFTNLIQTNQRHLYLKHVVRGVAARSPRPKERVQGKTWVVICWGCAVEGSLARTNGLQRVTGGCAVDDRQGWGSDRREMRGITPNWVFGYTDDDTYDAATLHWGNKRENNIDDH